MPPHKPHATSQPSRFSPLLSFLDHRAPQTYAMEQYSCITQTVAPAPSCKATLRNLDAALPGRPASLRLEAGSHHCTGAANSHCGHPSSQPRAHAWHASSRRAAPCSAARSGHGIAPTREVAEAGTPFTPGLFHGTKTSAGTTTR